MGATYLVTLQRDAEGQFIEIPEELAPLAENLVIYPDGDRLIIQPAGAEPPIEGESACSRPHRKDHP
ncbi:hypothetical protein [Pararhizobium sp. LjRoot238]|uniref:hypothetical protein n=1 Tax=Pararhizobium sp. LjRoot238 TaxID=3342293 RepID=UPI003ECE7745